MVVSWIGINDVRVQEDVNVCMTQLFEMAEMMYLTGARHFIYITVPPLNRTPAGTSTPPPPLRNVFSRASLTLDNAHGWYTNGVLNWNTNLTHSLQQYSSLHDDITISLYDSSRIFNRVLDDPQGYGFVDSNQVCSTGECVWFDNFHPGSAFYKVFAKDFAEFLEESVFVEGIVG